MNKGSVSDTHRSVLQPLSWTNCQHWRQLNNCGHFTVSVKNVLNKRIWAQNVNFQSQRQVYYPPPRPGLPSTTHHSLQLRPTSWWSGQTKSHVLSLGWDVWSSPPPPAPSGSWAGPGSLCTWPRRPQLGHTPPRCWNRQQSGQGWGVSKNRVFCFILSCCIDAQRVTDKV